MSEDRLIKRMIEQGRIGRPKQRRVEEFEHLDPETGLTRLTGSNEDKLARDFVVRLMEECGLEVRVDIAGNIFGRREGKVEKGGVLIGSHIDSVIDGGMFDGDVGVFGAIEAINRLEDEDFENLRPVEIVVYTGEEGSSFNYLLLGSSVLTGKLNAENAYKIKNRKGETFLSALENIGYRGDYRKDLSEVEYQLELHVEQGPVLEKKDYEIGIVQNITGLRWMHGEVLGVQGHAGTTPMQFRRDSLVAVSELISYVNERAKQISETTVGTIGEMYVYPNRQNVIPSRVTFEVDLRDVNEIHLKHLESDVIAKSNEIKNRMGVDIAIGTEFSHESTPMDDEVKASIKSASDSLKFSNIGINSGAGHDSQNLAHRVKTGMIFIPSKSGISHAPMEWTDWDLVEKGVKVLAESVRELSKRPLN